MVWSCFQFDQLINTRTTPCFAFWMFIGTNVLSFCGLISPGYGVAVQMKCLTRWCASMCCTCDYNIFVSLIYSSSWGDSWRPVLIQYTMSCLIVTWVVFASVNSTTVTHTLAALPPTTQKICGVWTVSDCERDQLLHVTPLAQLETPATWQIQGTLHFETLVNMIFGDYNSMLINW